MAARFWLDRSTARKAVERVESAEGLRGLRAEWEFTHWLVGSSAARGGSPVSPESERWVVLPDGRWAAVPPGESSEFVAVQLRAAQEGVQVTLRPSLWGMIAVPVVAFALVHALAFDPLYAATDEIQPPYWWSWIWALGCTGLIVGSVLIHELAHVAAGVMFGGRWAALVFDQAGARVVILPSQPTGWSRIIRSLAGPLAQLLLCLAMMATVAAESEPLAFLMRGQQYAIWWVAGFIGAVIALTNLLPIQGVDGGKAVEGVRDLGKTSEYRGADESIYVPWHKP